MYNPAFNSVLVELDTEADKWGTGNDDSMLGMDYSKGTLIKEGEYVPTKDYQQLPTSVIPQGASILWNKGAEAGTEFEHDDKQYAFIYWWDIRGCKI